MHSYYCIYFLWAKYMLVTIKPLATDSNLHKGSGEQEQTIGVHKWIESYNKINF